MVDFSTLLFSLLGISVLVFGVPWLWRQNRAMKERKESALNDLNVMPREERTKMRDVVLAVIYDRLHSQMGSYTTPWLVVQDLKELEDSSEPLSRDIDVNLDHINSILETLQGLELIRFGQLKDGQIARDKIFLTRAGFTYIDQKLDAPVEDKSAGIQISIEGSTNTQIAIASPDAKQEQSYQDNPIRGEIDALIKRFNSAMESGELVVADPDGAKEVAQELNDASQDTKSWPRRMRIGLQALQSVLLAAVKTAVTEQLSEEATRLLSGLRS
jgi:hypothetical protein